MVSQISLLAHAFNSRLELGDTIGRVDALSNNDVELGLVTRNAGTDSLPQKVLSLLDV